MSKKSIAVIASLILASVSIAAERSANAYKASKISTTTVLVSCNDEREPVITHLENTTAIVVTCKLEK